MVNVAIIPARGGSKRIPNKNIKLFHGKPIIAYSIESALQSDLFSRVIVSTDDDAIAEVAKEYGAEVPFTRPEALSDDFTGTNAVVNHAVEFLNDQRYFFNYVCCIYATAPLLQVKYLKKAHDKLVHKSKHYVFSATRFPFPIQRAIHLSQAEGDKLMPFDGSAYTKRSQDLSEFYHDAGQFYWGVPRAFTSDYKLFSGNSDICLLPRHEVCDIDTYEDWRVAELMYSNFEQLCTTYEE